MTAGLLLFGGASAADGDAIPDPGHPTEPHSRLYSADGYNPRIPTLVIVQILDGAPLPADHDTATEVYAKYFGPNPSVADYFTTISDGEFTITPAAESQGVLDDGVVFVRFGPWEDYFTDGPEAELGRSVNAADVAVDFSVFDTNGDDIVDPTELAIVVARPTRPDKNDIGGIARSIADVDDLDGVRLTTWGAAVGALTNSITVAHEIGHLALGISDLYGMGVGSYDISGPTIAGSERWWASSPMQNYHLGWETPEIVTRDGWLEVPVAATSGDPHSYVLYEPGSTDDYLIVEHRASAPAKYDRDLPDSGLLIWAVRDDLYFTESPEHERPLELVRPDGVRAPGCHDHDVDGLQHEDPAVSIGATNGWIDANGNDRLDDEDDLDSYLRYPLIDGRIDLDKDGVVGPRFTWPHESPPDTGIVGGIQIIQGRVDVDGDGAIGWADDGDPWTGIDNDSDGQTDENGPNGFCYAGNGFDAWNPADPNTPQRTLEGPVPGGRATSVAVRNLWPAENGVVRVYADVPGPGLLVDTFPAVFTDTVDPATGATASTPFVPEFRPGETLPIDLLLMNTGDEGSGPVRALVTIEGPEGWSSSTAVTSFAPGVEVPITLDLVAPRTHIGGTVELEAVLKEVGGTLESRSPLTVRLLPEAPEPDPYEFNDGSNIPTTAPQHRDHGVTTLLGGRFERWTGHLGDANIHEFNDPSGWGGDQDYYRFALPTDPDDLGAGPNGDIHLAGLPECGTVETSDGPVVVSSQITVQLVPETAGARLNTFVLDPRDRSNGSHVIDCPAEKLADDGRGAGEFVFWATADEQDVYPFYSVNVEYIIDVLGVSQKARWLLDAEQAVEGTIGRVSCHGGYFPVCSDEAPFLQLDLAHPFDEALDCLAGCVDHAVFDWASTTAFDAMFQAPSSFSFELLNESGDVLATSAVVDDPGAYGHPSFGTEEWQSSGAGGFNDEFVAGSPFVEDRSAAQVAEEPSDDQDPLGYHRLASPELPPGFYVLRISGGKTDGIPTSLLRPSPVMDVMSYSKPATLTEPGGTMTQVIELTNTGTATASVDAVIDDDGELLEPLSCQLPLLLSPGETTQCAADVEVLGAPGERSLAATVHATVAGVPRMFPANAVVTIDDLLPAVSLDVPDPGSIASPGGTVVLRPSLSNRSSEDVTIDSVTVGVATDQDGDGIADEHVEIEAACGPSAVIEGGGALECEVPVEVAVHPWSEPRWTVVARGADDDGSDVVLADAGDIGVIGEPGTLEVGEIDVTSQARLTIEHAIDGYVTVPTGRDLLNIEITLHAPHDPVLVTGVEADVGCTAPLPFVVSDDARLRVVCDLDGAAEGVDVGLSLITHGGQQPPVVDVEHPSPVRIEVKPGDDDDKQLHTSSKGVVPVVLYGSSLTVGVDHVDVATACFGALAPELRTCTEVHGHGHIEDTDEDGVDDLVLHYRADELGLHPADLALVCLSARVDDGVIEGCGVVRPR